MGTSKAEEPEQKLAALRCSPNPVQDRVRVEGEAPFHSAWLTNALGEIVRQWHFEPTRDAMLGLGDLPAGAYWLIVQGDTGIGTLGLSRP